MSRLNGAQKPELLPSLQAGLPSACTGTELITRTANVVTLTREAKSVLALAQGDSLKLVEGRSRFTSPFWNATQVTLQPLPTQRKRNSLHMMDQKFLLLVSVLQRLKPKGNADYPVRFFVVSTTQPKTPQTCCKLSILPVCRKLFTTCRQQAVASHANAS